MDEWLETWFWYFIWYLGTINFYNGDKYSGGMVQNKKEGNIGSYEWSTGDRVKGQFLDNLPLRGKILIKNEGQFDFDLNR